MLDWFKQSHLNAAAWLGRADSMAKPCAWCDTKFLRDPGGHQELEKRCMREVMAKGHPNKPGGCIGIITADNVEPQK